MANLHDHSHPVQVHTFQVIYLHNFREVVQLISYCLAQ
jgi:hypothetical protein